MCIRAILFLFDNYVTYRKFIRAILFLFDYYITYRMFISAVLFLVISSAYCHAETRNVVKSLRVYNGGKWGDWNTAQFCPKGQYATGYRMKVYTRTMQYCERIIIREVLIFVKLVVD
jgi:hypothetical protein